MGTRWGWARLCVGGNLMSRQAPRHLPRGGVEVILIPHIVYHVTVWPSIVRGTRWKDWAGERGIKIEGSECVCGEVMSSDVQDAGNQLAHQASVDRILCPRKQARRMLGRMHSLYMRRRCRKRTRGRGIRGGALRRDRLRGRNRGEHHRAPLNVSCDKNC